MYEVYLHGPADAVPVLHSRHRTLACALATLRALTEPARHPAVDWPCRSGDVIHSGTGEWIATVGALAT